MRAHNLTTQQLSVNDQLGFSQKGGAELVNSGFVMADVMMIHSELGMSPYLKCRIQVSRGEGTMEQKFD